LLGTLSIYPDPDEPKIVWYIHCRNDWCRGTVEPRLQGAGIKSEADAIAFMDKLEPKLLRWQAEMLEASARARADVRARAEAFVCNAGLTELARLSQAAGYDDMARPQWVEVELGGKINENLQPLAMPSFPASRAD
jgi:hypothetical protein